MSEEKRKRKIQKKQRQTDVLRREKERGQTNKDRYQKEIQ